MDPDEGTVVQFVPMKEINGHYCAQIVTSDIHVEVQYWSTAVICGVVSPNPLVDVIEGFVRRIWGSMDIDRVVLARKAVYLS